MLSRLFLLAATLAVPAIPLAARPAFADTPSPASLFMQQTLQGATPARQLSLKGSPAALALANLAERKRQSVFRSAQNMLDRIRAARLDPMWRAGDSAMAQSYGDWARWYGQMADWHASQGNPDQAAAFYEAAAQAWENAAWSSESHERDLAIQAAEFGWNARNEAARERFDEARRQRDRAEQTFPFDD